MSSEKPAVSKDLAEAEFARFCAKMGLDTDPEGMDADDLKGFNNSKRRVIAAMMTGSLIIEENGEPVFTPQIGDTSPITFSSPNGASLMAMDLVKKDHDTEKTFATLADITGQTKKRYAQMDNRDLKVCLAVMLLFLG
jgi:hypothetical protein